MYRWEIQRQWNKEACSRAELEACEDQKEQERLVCSKQRQLRWRGGTCRQQKVNVIDFSFFCGVDAIVIVIKKK